MAIKLEIFASDPEVIALLNRYWATNEAGEWLEKVNALLPFRDIPNSSVLAGYIRTQCSVFDENQTCSVCGCALKIKSRSEAKKFPHHPVRPCDSCKEVIEEERRVAEAQAEAELRRRIANHALTVGAQSIEYEAVPDDLAFIVLALNRAFSNRLQGGSFKYDDCNTLAPMYTREFIDRLWKAGVLSDNPHAPGPMAYLIKNEGLSYYPHRVSFFLVPNEKAGGGGQNLEALTDRSFNDKQSLLALWLDYAVAECMAFLYDQCSEYRLEVPLNKECEIRNIVYTALKFFSIAEVWCMMWRVVQNASSLAGRKYFTRNAAAASIPVKLLRQFEDARKGKIGLTKWYRLKSLTAGTLGQLFHEMYGLDENTDSSVVFKLFSENLEVDRKKIEASIDTQVQAIMTSALASNRGAAVMYDFAEAIRSGAGISEAVGQLTDAYATPKEEPESG